MTALVLCLALPWPGLDVAGEASEPAQLAVTASHCGGSENADVYVQGPTPGPNFCPDLLVGPVPDNDWGRSFAPVPGGEDGFTPSWSPDGRQLAFTRFLPDSGAPVESDIFVIDASGGMPINVTDHPAYDWAPAWSPDGSRIAFASDRDGTADVYVIDAGGPSPVRVTTGSGLSGRLTWSPDGQRIAFDCVVDAGNRDLCAVGVADGAIVRLTDHPGADVDPAWSPDGARIAFASDRAGQLELHVMQPDGSGVTRVGSGIVGAEPTWSPDGARIAFTFPQAPRSVYVVNADGTRLRFVTGGFAPAWKPTGTIFNEWPVATFTVACDGLACTFDASGSHDPDGSITSYAWQFGAGGSGSGVTVTHTYFEPGAYDVILTVVDDGGIATSETVRVVTPAMHVSDLDASSADQPGGWTAAVKVTVHDERHRPLADAWVGGDWSDSLSQGCRTSSNGECTVSRSGIPKTTASLVFTVNGLSRGGLVRGGADNHDPDGDSDGTSITVTRPGLHVGDLDASSTGQAGGWTARVRIAVHNRAHRGVASARVTGAWHDGTAGACTTNLNGLCTVSRSGIPRTTASLVFTVAGVAHARLIHAAADDHDPDGDSDGTSITVTRPGLHVGDLDASSTSQAGGWTARVRIAVHNRAHGGVASARVTGAWSDGTAGACTTNVNGRCAVSRSGVPATTTGLTFAVVDVAHARLTYSPADNHDPDGDSGGTSITVVMP